MAATVLDGDGFVLCTTAEVNASVMVGKGELVPTKSPGIYRVSTVHPSCRLTPAALRSARRRAYLAARRAN